MLCVSPRYDLRGCLGVKYQESIACVTEGPHSPGREPLRADDFYSAGPQQDRDGYYSDHDVDGYRGPPEEDVFTRPHDE